MIEELIDLINTNKNVLNNPKGLKQISNFIDDFIELETWDISFKKIVTIFKEQKWEKRTIQIVLSFWSKEIKDLDTIFIVSIKYFLLNREDLNYLYEILDLSDLKTLLKKSIEISDNSNYHILANNIISFFSEDLNGKEYIELLRYSEIFQEENGVNLESVKDFFTFKKSQYVYAEIPDWVNVEPGENLSLLMTVNPGLPVEDVETSVVKIVKKAKDYFYITPDILKEEKDEDNDEDGVTLIPEMNEALLKFLKASSLEESEVASHQANRVFGPANRFKDKNCISNPGKNGPCRMLECLCRELDEDDPEEWFFEVCENYFCKRKIRDRSHAIRIPIEEGGWKGSFCSFDCLDESLEFKDKDMAFRIEAMKVSLFDDGIMDRTKT